MSTGICSCANPTFGNLGRPNCVIEMRTMAFPIIVPRYQADGVTRNGIDVTSPTIGADVQALLSASLDPQSRIYPFPRVEEPTFERTETVYETAPSARKYKIEGLGGIYTLAFKTYAKDAVAALLKEAEKFGCSDFDFYYVDVAGNLWGELEGDKLYGYMASAETFDAFMEFATDTTVQKMMVSWDLDSDVALACSMALTPEDLGYKATTLEANIAANQSLTAASATSIVDVVSTGFGSAASPDYVEGLLVGDFAVYNVTTSAAIAPDSITETTAGNYTIDVTTAAPTTGDVIRVTITKAGYDFAVETVVSL